MFQTYLKLKLDALITTIIGFCFTYPCFLYKFKSLISFTKYPEGYDSFFLYLALMKMRERIIIKNIWRKNTYVPFRYENNLLA